MTIIPAQYKEFAKRRYRYLLAVCLFLLSNISAFAQASEISVDFSSGCTPLVVNFTPVNPPCSGCTYSWNFGTGSPITGYSVSSSFITAGIHVVTLTVTDGATSGSSTKTITTYPAPTVSFSVDDTAMCPGGSVLFSNTSTNGAPGYASKTWSFGDATTDTGNTATHTYPLAGYYNVALTVTNSQGCAKTLVKTSLIHIYSKPVAGFTKNKTTLCNPPGSVLFTNTTTGTSPLAYIWKFGDGGTSTGTSPSHSYVTTGSFYVSLKATDVNGCVDSITSSDYIYVGAVTASFTAPASACLFAPVSFTNTSTTHTFRRWAFGDGDTSTAINGTHTYTALGTYPVKLVAAFSPCIDSQTKFINIVGGPPGGYTASPANPCPAQVTVNYTSTAPPGTIVTWNFEKGTFASGPSVNHTYKVDSIVHITMFKTDPVTGCKDTLYTLDTLYDHIHYISSDTDRGCAPFNVTLYWTNLTSKPDGYAHPYPHGVGATTWDFGDGSPTVTDDTVSHTYADTGVYIATVAASTGNGCSIIDTIFIRVGNPPAATFTASPLHACKNDTITFTADIITGPIDSFVWDFTDFMTFSDTAEIRRPFTLPGLFTVTFTPCHNGCCGDTFVMRDYVLIDSPKVAMHWKFNCPIDRQIMFFDSSLGNDSTIWAFGDGDTSYLRYPAHTYASEGTYDVELIVFNSASGCTDRRKNEVLVVDPDPDFTANTRELCSYDTVSFLASDTSLATLTYRWLIDTTVSIWDGSPAYEHPFSLPGKYTVRLVAWDNNNCYDTVTKTDYIVFGKPIAGFASSPPKGCVPLAVTFTDTSQNVTGLTSIHFKWYFGDGDSASLATPTVTHTYTAIGTYTVTMVVTNNNSCKDTISQQVIVTKAYPSFSASTTHPCVGGSVTFNNTSLAVTSSSWAFGDGTYSLATSPSHSYSDTGSYAVSLTITDTNGCTGTATYDDYITMGEPKASFYMDDSLSVCTPFLVQFFNTTTGASSYSWTFGDGQTSVVVSPTNSYSIAGIYNIRLIATSIYGCRDTAYNQVTAYGYTSVLNYSPISGCSPLTVSFNATLPNVPYILCDFSDGTTSLMTSGVPLTHTYVTPGAYVPRLIISDTEGCTNSVIGADTIKVSAVVAKFTTTPNPVCPGTTFNFVDASTTYWSPVTTRMWVYDGITSYAGSPSHSITTPGTYPIHLQVTNGWGCTGTKDTDLVVLAIAPITGTLRVCTGRTTVLNDATPGGTWTSSVPTIATVSAGTVTGVAAGTATITYTVSGCHTTVVVTVDASPTPIAGTMALCAGTTSTIANTIGGGTWSSTTPGVGTIATASSLSAIVTGIAAGTTVVSYILANTCYVSAEVTVNPSPGPITGDTVFCTGISTVLSNTVGGGTWSSSDTNTVKVSTTGVATGLLAGTATVSYALGDCFSIVKVTVDDFVPAITGEDTICAGATTILSNSETGGTWSSSDTAIAKVGATTGIVSGTASGTANITYSLGGGCVIAISVAVLPIPDPGSISGLAEVCVGSTISLSNSAAGGSWSSSNTNAVISSTGVLRGVAPGMVTISYTVTDLRCPAFATKEITTNPLPYPGTISGAASLCAGATVILDATVSGGKWSSGNTGVATIDTGTGSVTTYTTGTTTIIYTVTDTNGCSDSTTFVLSVTPPPFSFAGSVTDVKCHGGQDGAISLSFNGTPPFEFLWSNGETGIMIDSLQNGTYSVTVTQPATHCSLADNFTVSEPDSIIIVADLIPDTCQLGRGSIQVSAAGGTAPYTFAWSNPAGNVGTTTLITGLKADTYLLTLTDARDCIDTFSIPLTEDSCNTLVIHDVITPNGDGANDTWVIERIHLYPDNVVQIFDKWGDLVYEKRAYQNEWYGQGKNGNPLPDGTYFYIVKLNQVNKTGGNSDFAGTILVKR